MEAQLSFGRPELFIEEYIEKARHIEVQVKEMFFMRKNNFNIQIPVSCFQIMKPTLKPKKLSFSLNF